MCDASSAAGSYGGYSFSVEKGVSGGRTFTRVQELTRQQRREELARLTGSGQTSQTMIDSAEELLSAADAFKKALV